MEVNNLTSFSLNEDMLRKVAEFVFEKEEESGSISIALVELEEIRRLNKAYRGKDSATDVLSFVFGEEGLDFRGEVIICPHKLEKEKDLPRAVLRVLVHGVLHVLGYDHKKGEDEEKMKKKENLYFSMVENNFLKR